MRKSTSAGADRNFPNVVHMRILQEVRNEMGSEGTDLSDTRLLNFLRARNYRVPDAISFLKEHIKWRKTNEVESIVQDFPNTAIGKLGIEYWPNRVHGLDKLGLPVIYDKIGSCDIRSLLRVLSKEDAIKLHIYFHERQQKNVDDAAARAKHPFDCGIIFVIDLEGLGWNHMYAPGISIAKEILTIDQSHFPETLRKCIVINAPKIFTTFYAALKPFIDPRMLEKIEIYGKDGFQQALQNDIPLDQIPVEYGGKCAEHQKRCIGGGGSLPNENSMPEGETVTISPGDQHVVIVETEEENTTILWNFHCPHEVGFSVSRHNSDKKHEICSYFKYEGSKHHQNQLIVPKGRYAFTWDNSRSIFKGKTITYRVDVVRPDMME